MRGNSSTCPHNTIFSKHGVGHIARVRQGAELKFAQITMNTPMLVWVQRGSKLIQWVKGKNVLHSTVVNAGQVVAIAAGSVLDVTNRIPGQGVYEALCLSWDQSLIDADIAAQIMHSIRQRDTCLIDVMPVQEEMPFLFKGALERAAWSIEHEAPLDVAKHTMQELLIWLRLWGGHFASSSPLRFSQKIRQLLMQDLSVHWLAQDIANRMAVSQATLRRRLAQEHTTFHEISVDTRMSHALFLLQCTQQPISQIALSVGYESASRFSARFKVRFGFSPSELKGGCS